MPARCAITGKECINTIVTAVPFFENYPDSRQGGMGDAGIAVAGDAIIGCQFFLWYFADKTNLFLLRIHHGLRTHWGLPMCTWPM